MRAKCGRVYEEYRPDVCMCVCVCVCVCVCSAKEFRGEPLTVDYEGTRLLACRQPQVTCREQRRKRTNKQVFVWRKRPALCIQ